MEQLNPLLQLFIGQSRQLLYERDDIIIRAGDTPSGMYLINRGWVKTYNLCEDGEPNIIMSLGVWDIFPLEWGLSGTLHEVSFAALETTQVTRISRDQFLQQLQDNSNVLQAACQKLIQYYFRLSNELEYLPYRSARERVAYRLVTLAEYFGSVRTKPVELKPWIPNEYIARSSNMTRETASRELSWLTKKGFIRRQDGYIIIKDLAALKHEIGKDFPLSISTEPP